MGSAFLNNLPTKGKVLPRINPKRRNPSSFFEKRQSLVDPRHQLHNQRGVKESQGESKKTRHIRQVFLTFILNGSHSLLPYFFSPSLHAHGTASHLPISVAQERRESAFLVTEFLDCAALGIVGLPSWSSSLSHLYPPVWPDPLPVLPPEDGGSHIAVHQAGDVHLREKTLKSQVKPSLAYRTSRKKEKVQQTRKSLF